jgi:hypothetical protein
MTVLGLALAGPASANVVRSGGVSYVKKNVVLKPLKKARLTVACPKHTHVLGGGADSKGAYGTSLLSQTYPVDLSDKDKKPDDGWGSLVRNRAKEKIKVSFVATCGKFAMHYVQEKFSIMKSDSESEHDVSCPAGENAFSGGVRGPARIQFDSTFPYGEGALDPRWSSYYLSLGKAAKATSYALCSSATPTFRVSSVNPAQSPGRNHRAPKCSPNRRVYAGGLASDGTQPVTLVAAAAPDPTTGTGGAFDVAMDVDAPFDVEVTFYAICGPKL